MSDDKTKETPPMLRVALKKLYETHAATGGDPRITFVTMMTGAVMAGHMIERPREEMHKVLDEVHDVALAQILHITEKKH